MSEKNFITNALTESKFTSQKFLKLIPTLSFILLTSCSPQKSESIYFEPIDNTSHKRSESKSTESKKSEKISPTDEYILYRTELILEFQQKAENSQIYENDMVNKYQMEYDKSITKYRTERVGVLGIKFDSRVEDLRPFRNKDQKQLQIKAQEANYRKSLLSALELQNKIYAKQFGIKKSLGMYSSEVDDTIDVNGRVSQDLLNYISQLRLSKTGLRKKEHLPIFTLR